MVHNAQDLWTTSIRMTCNSWGPQTVLIEPTQTDHAEDLWITSIIMMCNVFLLIFAGVAAAPLVGSQQFATLLVSFCLHDCCTTQLAGLLVMSCLLTLQADAL